MLARFHIFFKTNIFLIFCIIGFIFIRSLHFAEFFNFSTDQAEFSRQALKLWRDKEITLVGPTASFNYQGLYLRQSSVIFYTTLLFLLPVNLSLKASYFFMVASSLMCIPLFYGVQKLFNKNMAVLMTGIYAFFPFFLPYTTFLWNPNYQFVLLPLLVYSMAKLKETRINLWSFTSGVIAGVLLLYHYQFVVIISFISLTLLFFAIKKKINSNILLSWIVGLVVGYFPLIAFEINSHFYISKIVLLLLQHPTQSSTSFAPHYILWLVFALILILVGCVTKKWPQLLSYKTAILIVGLFFITSLIIYGLPPKNAFGSPVGWNYSLEQKAHQIISEQKLANFAVVNTLYETKATVQYYLLEKNSITGWTQNYYENEYVFIIAKKDRMYFLDDPAYELNSFTPVEEVDRWELSPEYDLVLEKRV